MMIFTLPPLWGVVCTLVSRARGLGMLWFFGGGLVGGFLSLVLPFVGFLFGHATVRWTFLALAAAAAATPLWLALRHRRKRNIEAPRVVSEGARRLRVATVGVVAFIASLLFTDQQFADAQWCQVGRTTLPEYRRLLAAAREQRWERGLSSAESERQEVVPELQRRHAELTRQARFVDDRVAAMHALMTANNFRLIRALLRPSDGTRNPEQMDFLYERQATLLGWPVCNRYCYESVLVKVARPGAEVRGNARMFTVQDAPDAFYYEPLFSSFLKGGAPFSVTSPIPVGCPRELPSGWVERYDATPFSAQ